MNTIKAQIREIKTEKELVYIKLHGMGQDLFSIIIKDSRLGMSIFEGSEVSVVFKESEVALGKGLSGKLSLRNRIKGTIENIRNDGVLTEVSIDAGGEKIVSVISAASAEEMELSKGDDVEALVKTTEVSVMV